MLTQDQITKDIQEYLDNGGKITYLPYAVKSDYDDFQNFAHLNHNAAKEYKERGHMKNGRKVK